MANESSLLFVIVTAIGYFVVAVGLGAALLFPSVGLALLRHCGRACTALFDRLFAGAARIKGRAGTLGSEGGRELRHWTVLMRRHRLLVSVAVLAVLAPAVVALSLQRYVRIGGFEESTQPSDPVILALLRGEQLVPPAPLPPEVFTAREVELLRPALGSASRNWDLLDAEFRQRLLAVFQVMRQYGYEMALLEGYRSPERQDYLASLGQHVTSAAAFQSYHQFGLAADCAFYLNGRIVLDERDPWAMRGYKLYGEAAEAAGLAWGGRWKMMDFGHVELRRPGAVARDK